MHDVPEIACAPATNAVVMLDESEEGELIARVPAPGPEG